MLLFEFFPAFVMLVSLVVGVWLFLMDREARADGPPESGSHDCGLHDRGPATRS